MKPGLIEFKEIVDQQKIIFCFCGPVSHVLLVEIGDIVKSKMTKSAPGINKSVFSRAFAILVEQVQNIIHYSAEKYPIAKQLDLSDQLSVGIITVGREDNFISVVCGNIIENKHMEILQQRLTRLQKMDKDEMKVYYKEQRRKEPDDGSKGAGLGFIEMARKSSRPLEYEFKPVDESHSFFIIKALV